MLSKRKLAVILPMLFELAMSYEYYYGPDIVPLKHRATNRWGKVDEAEKEGMVKIGSIGGGYYGMTVPGLREEEEGDAGERAFGSKVKSYPYTQEAERTLTKDSLVSLPPEARLRMMREPFREHIFNTTGQLPTLEELKKLEPQFKEFVKKELGLTSPEVKSLFGTPSTKKEDGKLPKYLLFDDMDKFDFDPEEALKYMPRIPKKATKKELDAAYLKAWEMLGKSNKRLKKVYQAYRRKYLEKNPLGPIMTEKEFLLYSIKLREREATRLGFVPSSPDQHPIVRNIEISYFLREALKDDYEKYKSQSSNDRFSTATNFVYDALFNDDLILDGMDATHEPASPETLPSPYDPIEGRAWTDTVSGSSILNVTDAYNKIINRESVYNKNGDLVLIPEEKQELGREQEHETVPDVEGSNELEKEYGGSDGISSQTLTPFHKLTRINKTLNVKSPSQLLFERSEYSTSAQKRVIDRLDDFTLVSFNDMSPDQLMKFHSLIYDNFYTEAERKEEEKYFKQRIGEQGGDTGTNSEVYREFLFNKIGNKLFFIPKEININKNDYSGIALPVAATGFEMVENEDGVAKIHHAASGLSFNVDYSGKGSFYLNGYLGLINDSNLPSPNVKTFVSSGWKVTDSQIPSPYRVISAIDKGVSKFSGFDSSISLLRDNLRDSAITEDNQLAGKISAFLARSPHLLKNYEESRNAYIRSQEKLLDELNKSKSIFRSGAVLESLNRVSDSLLGNSVAGVDVAKFSEGLNKDKLEAFLKQRDELRDITHDEYNMHMSQLDEVNKECLNNYFKFVNSCNDLIVESGKINNEIAGSSSEMAQRFTSSMDKKQEIGSKILDEVSKLHLVNGNLKNNADMLLALNMETIGLNRLVETPEASKVLEEEALKILNGKKKAEDYKKLIDSSKLTTKYYIEKPAESVGEDSDEEEEEDDKKKKGKHKKSAKLTKTSEYSTDFKGKVRIVFDESLTIIEDHIRDLYIAVVDRRERMAELLKLEAFLIRELSRHRRALSIVLNRVVLPEDEIIDESETDELKIRILLKIHEEKTKLIYVREILDKTFFYPHFPGVKPSFSLKLRELEEEGIRSRLGFTYLPKFRYDEDEKPIGIYGFKKVDYFDLREEFFSRLISGFEYDMDSYMFELEIMDLIESLNYPELNRLMRSDSYIESSIFSKRTSLVRVLKKLIKTEKDQELRRALKRIYFSINGWIKDVIRFEMRHYGSSALESIISSSSSSSSEKTTKGGSHESTSSSEERPSPSGSVGGARRRIRKGGLSSSN